MARFDPLKWFGARRGRRRGSLPPTISKTYADPAVPLRSVHSDNFPGLLNELGISLLVTTYQVGKVVLVRADGNRLNAKFCDHPAPMGAALDNHRLAVAGPYAIWEFHNVPNVARKVDPSGKVDACFLPRRLHVTGNIQIHEMAWVDERLCFVNTRFSCLCTRDPQHNFVPFWRPPFVNALAPEDRCHLNGFALVEGKIRFVTALGATDTPGGWRERRNQSGILMDVATGQVVTGGLSMPHSPRWNGGQLWLLESGRGGIGTVDLGTGRYQEVAALPGFTRGLDFHGPLAFVGLSQARESAVFGGLAIADKSRERHFGVWVMNRYTGQTVAFWRFEDVVQEIFDVKVLTGMRYPDLLTDGADPYVLDSFVIPQEALRDIALATDPRPRRR